MVLSPSRDFRNHFGTRLCFSEFLRYAVMYLRYFAVGADGEPLWDEMHAYNRWLQVCLGCSIEPPGQKSSMFVVPATYILLTPIHGAKECTTEIV